VPVALALKTNERTITSRQCEINRSRQNTEESLECFLNTMALLHDAFKFSASLNLLRRQHNDGENNLK